MAQITGFICDVCEGFSLNRDGWVKVHPYVSKDAKVADTGNGIDVCSNDCLVHLGIERGGKVKTQRPPRRLWTDDEKLEIVRYATEHGVAETVAKYSVDQTLVYRWKRQMTGDGGGRDR